MKEDAVVIVSYFPLLRADRVFLDNDIETAMKELAEKLEALPENAGHAVACVWGLDDNKLFPVLVIDKAAEVADHLKWWSYGKPEDWFDLYIAERGNAYAVLLMPRLDKSIERMNAASIQIRETVIDPGAKYHILFKPITFVTGDSTTYRKSVDRFQLADPTPVSLLDLSEVDMESHQINLSAQIPLGVFQRKQVGQGSENEIELTEGYLDGLFKDMQPPKHSSWLNPDV